ncbi:serine hydrolase [Phenylobacterium aquaticum]|uniref:serine hydrolase domain-containing protein n=1 Tax=Phenylobacterium aquaticum TaxID=1763816 RepID=UPI0026EAAAB7|nr:serine hydrolase domain-containing protein [Phenylobacterium aquaticum]
MRLSAKTALAALAALLLIPAATRAQDAAATVAAGPQGPIPYTALRHRTTRSRLAHPGPRTTTAKAATTRIPTAENAPAALITAPALPATAAGARLATVEPLPQAELEAFTDGLIRDAMDREHIAGVTVAVVQNGQVVLKKGYGAASLSPLRRVDPDTTLFRIGSISKTFTWIALMKEVEAGRMRIDGPVNLYLPETLQIRDQGFRAPVRVINLMDHSGGFEDRALGQLIEKNPARERALSEYLRQEWPRRMESPGAISSYSNYGAALAGEAVSYVTGRPYERLIEDEILSPLALNHTTLREARPRVAGLPGPMPQALTSDLSQGFRWTASGFKSRPYEYLGHVAPSGSASSTAGDMARYMSMLLNEGHLDGATIYGPRAAEAFRTPIRQTPAGINGWAHGFIQYALPGGHMGFGHDGATLSFVSRMVVSPDLKLGVFISTNTETGAELIRRYPDRLVRQFYMPPQIFPRPGDPALLAQAKRFEGHYVSSRRKFGGLEGLIDLLQAGVKVEVTPEGRLLTIGAEGPRAWVPVGDPAAGRFISATGDEHLAFLGDGRRADAFLGALGDQTYQRANLWSQASVLVVLAALTALCAAATLAGIFLRNRREFRETSIQNLAGLVQNLQAALWLTAFALFGMWLSETGDTAAVMYNWPGASLVIAEGCAIVSALLTGGTALAVPYIWRGGRRVDSWTQLRKTGFTVTVLIYLSLSILLLHDLWEPLRW